MIRVSRLLVCLLIFAIGGCKPAIDDSTSGGVVLGAPWNDTDSVGAVSSLLGPTLKISSTKGTLFSILETVANHFSVTIAVDPSFLLDRTLTVELEGDSAETVLASLAKQASLELSRLADDKWQLVHPSLRDGKIETVKQSDY